MALSSGLGAELATELTSLFEEQFWKVQGNVAEPAVTYRWDQIHEIIVKNSFNTSLVIANLPDPPDLGGNDADGSFREGALMATDCERMASDCDRRTIDCERMATDCDRMAIDCERGTSN